MAWVHSGNIKGPPGEVPTPRLRHFRPQLAGLAPGVASVVQGLYYFDGAQIHLELSIQNAVSGSGFVGTSPAFKTPSTMEMSTPIAALVLGVGHAHNATSGAMHPIAGRRITATDVLYSYWNGTTFAELTAAAPLPSGILNGLYIKVSYIPVVKSAPSNFVAFGDSITRFENAAGTFGVDRAWTPSVPVADSLVFGGGFAQDSATSAIVLAGAKKMEADVAVCLVGVNDIAGGVAQATTLANVLALKNKVQADRFVLCKLAPYNANTAAAAAMNTAFTTLASANGMTLIDPYAAYRQPSGAWTSGASTDGVHPTAAVQSAAALVYRAGIQAALAS